MDLRYRNEKYQEYLKKIKVAGNDVQEQIFLKSIKEKAKNTLDELRYDDDNGGSGFLLWFLIIPLVILVIWAISRFGYLHAIPLVMLLGFLFYYRTSIISVTKKATGMKLNLGSDKDEEEENSVLRQKIEYILCGLDIKRTRIKLIKQLYQLFFPLLLHYLYLQIYGGPAFSSHIISLIIAYLIGGTAWVFFFGDDIEHYESMESSFQEDLSKLIL